MKLQQVLPWRISENSNIFCKNFTKYKHRNKMRPVSNQPDRFYGTVKTFKTDNINNITSGSIKILPIIDQADFICTTLQKFFLITYILCVKMHIPSLIHNIFLHTSQISHYNKMIRICFIWNWIPIHKLLVLERIEYIIKRIYVHKKIKPVCSKLIFKRLLHKTAM